MSNSGFRKKIVISRSVKGTRALGGKTAQWLMKQDIGGGALVLALQGDLGSGKTTFIQGLAEGLGVKEKITSPTFVLMKKFKLSIANYQLPTTNYQLFYHFDCYRLDKPEEISALGWQEIVANPRNIVAIEWPERIKKFLPKGTIYLNFKFIDKNQREIKIGKTALFMVK